MQRDSPRISVIVPAHNAVDTLAACLEAIAASTFLPEEVLVICDGCTDGTADLARSFGARAIEYDGQHGASYARNVGAAAAHGDLLFFIDADCVAQPDTLAAGLAAFLEGEEVMLGSYTLDTRSAGFLSKFKNLQHHFTHQNGASYQPTFWSGCGVVAAEAFELIGGFDVDLPFCEDIEYGWHANQKGYRVRLVPSMQVEHLKQYDLSLLVRSDLLQRAVPWTQLIRSGRASMGAFNTDWRGKASVVATGLTILGALGALLWAPSLAIAGLASLLLLAINSDLLSLIRRELGWLSALAAVAALLVHYSICGVGFVVGHLRPKLPNSRAHATPVTWVEEEAVNTRQAMAARSSF